VTQGTERSTGHVWRLGLRVLLVQVVTLVALWVLQSMFAAG
jgi:hypothetical protein